MYGSSLGISCADPERGSSTRNRDCPLAVVSRTTCMAIQSRLRSRISATFQTPTHSPSAWRGRAKCFRKNRISPGVRGSIQPSSRVYPPILASVVQIPASLGSCFSFVTNSSSEEALAYGSSLGMSIVDSEKPSSTRNRDCPPAVVSRTTANNGELGDERSRMNQRVNHSGSSSCGSILFSPSCAAASSATFLGEHAGTADTAITTHAREDTLAECLDNFRRMPPPARLSRSPWRSPERRRYLLLSRSMPSGAHRYPQKSS